VRLLFVSNFYPPGHIGGFEENCHDVTQCLRTLGHEVTVLTSDGASETAGDGSVRRALRLLRRYSPEGPPRPLESIDQLRVDVHNSRILTSVVDELSPDSVVFWNGEGLSRAVLAAVPPRIPTAFYALDLWLATRIARETASSPPAIRAIYRIGAGRLGASTGPIPTANIVFCSEALASQFAERGINPGNSEVIHLGIPLDDFVSADSTPGGRDSTDESNRLLFVGRIGPEKGLLTLIEALSKVRTHHGFQRATLTIAGKISDHSFGVELEGAIAEARLGPNVHIVGGIPRVELPSLYTTHHLLVLPSTWVEPFGLVLVEAMACGLPVLAPDRGGPAEIVHDGYNGTLFKAGDPRDLADKIERCLSNPERVTALAKTARSEVAGRFSVSVQARKLASYLARLV
jgi:glycosyltransferase involved in cell wall biosynthesis